MKLLWFTKLSLCIPLFNIVLIDLLVNQHLLTKILLHLILFSYFLELILSKYHGCVLCRNCNHEYVPVHAEAVGSVRQLLTAVVSVVSVVHMSDSHLAASAVGIVPVQEMMWILLEYRSLVTLHKSSLANCITTKILPNFSKYSQVMDC